MLLFCWYFISFVSLASSDSPALPDGHVRMQVDSFGEPTPFEQTKTGARQDRRSSVRHHSMQQKPSNRTTPRICIGTVAAGTKYSQIREHTILNKKSYVERHGYELIDVRTDKELPYGEVISRKWSAFSKALEHCDVVFWMDADGIFVDKDLRIEDFMEGIGDKSFIFAKGSPTVSGGLMLVRSTSDGRQFVKRMKDATQQMVQAHGDISKIGIACVGGYRPTVAAAWSNDKDANMTSSGHHNYEQQLITCVLGFDQRQILLAASDTVLFCDHVAEGWRTGTFLKNLDGRYLAYQNWGCKVTIGCDTDMAIQQLQQVESCHNDALSVQCRAFGNSWTGWWTCSSPKLRDIGHDNITPNKWEPLFIVMSLLFPSIIAVGMARPTWGSATLMFAFPVACAMMVLGLEALEKTQFRFFPFFVTAAQMSAAYVVLPPSPRFRDAENGWSMQTTVIITILLGLYFLCTNRLQLGGKDLTGGMEVGLSLAMMVWSFVPLSLAATSMWYGLLPGGCGTALATTLSCFGMLACAMGAATSEWGVALSLWYCTGFPVKCQEIVAPHLSSGLSKLAMVVAVCFVISMMWSYILVVLNAQSKHMKSQEELLKTACLACCVIFLSISAYFEKASPYVEIGNLVISSLLALAASIGGFAALCRLHCKAARTVSVIEHASMCCLAVGATSAAHAFVYINLASPLHYAGLFLILLGVRLVPRAPMV